ncbi:hypothetical protein WDU94_008658 [Cyamophila willieti]
MRCTFGLYGTLLTLNSVCAITQSSKDFLEFFSVFMEGIAMGMVLMENIILNIKQTDVLRLLHCMNKFDVTSNRPIIIISRRFEKVIWIVYSGFIIFSIVIKFCVPFVPISGEESVKVQTLYGYKHPQNRLPQCLYIPYVDISEPNYFTFFYFLEMYWVLLIFALGISEALLFPLITLHLVVQNFIFSKRLHALGNPPVRMRTRLLLRHNKKKHDIIQVKKCMLVHRKLLAFRELFDNVTGTSINVRIILLIIITCLSAYPVTTLSQFSVQRQGFLIIEFSLMLSFYYYNCIMSEVLEWANCRLRTSIYQSKWYDMCPEAQRMMLMFLQRTQRPHYIRSLGGMVVLGNENFLRTINMIYSFIRFVNLKK